MIDFKLIGEKIKNIRNEKKITQEELAEMAEISVGYISNIETAKKIGFKTVHFTDEVNLEQLLKSEKVLY